MNNREMKIGSIFGMIGSFLLTSVFYVAKISTFDRMLITPYILISAGIFYLSIKSTKERNNIHAQDKLIGKYRYPMPPFWYGAYYILILMFTGLPILLGLLVHSREAFLILLYGGWATWLGLNLFSTKLLLKEVDLLTK